MPIGNSSRRNALKLFGTVAMGGILSLGATPVQGTKAVSRPVRARGVRTIRRIPQADGYTREVKFKVEETDPISVDSKDESIMMSVESGSYNIARRCRKLSEKGLLKHLGNGVYIITDQGEAYLAGDLDTETWTAVCRNNNKDSSATGNVSNST
ncbi:hypothetical protein [Halostagnicola sp. A56]|uniref:hypothetical protein n=1 Tax=Halostagnicola sp. A56 TaxID=1495067 RepID=UPI0018CCB640|nr:hypothetical protein [Halostagnicola sp. A56]